MYIISIMKIDTLHIKKNYSIIDIAIKLGIEVLNNNMCKCPFHKDGQEKNASMSFDISTNRYKCFACNLNGNNIDLVMKILNCNFMKAIEFITNDSYNKKTSYNQNNIKPTTTITTSKKKHSPTLYHDVYKSFINLLDDKHAIDYLESRNISAHITLKYKIKNLPNDYNKQVEILKQLQKLYSNNKLIDSGLYGLSSKTNNLYNKFYNHRLIISYIENNKILSLQGRCIDDDISVKSKYLYLQASPTNIYNLDILNSLKAMNNIIICEGVIDCLSWETLGENAIAIGSAGNIAKLDKDIIAKLSRLNIYIAGDNDTSGLNMNNSISKLLDNNNIIKYSSVDLPSIAKSFYVNNNCNDINDILQNIKIEAISNYKFCKYNEEFYFFDYGTISKHELDNIKTNKDLELLLKCKKEFNDAITLIK